MPNPCPTACCTWNNVPNRIYSSSPSQGASEKNIFKNKKKLTIFFKKKLLPNRMLRCSNRAQPSWIERPQISTSTLKKKISKKTWKMTEKNDFSFFSNSFQSLTLGKCLTRAQPHVARGIKCPTAYTIHPRVKRHPKKIFSKIKKN